MRVIALGLLLGCVGVIGTAGSAHAACEWTTVNELLEGHVQTHVVQVCSQDDAQTVSTTNSPPPTDFDLDSICVQTAISLGNNPFTFCDIPPEDAEELVTPGLVAAALARLPLPPSDLQVQPANGRTLVNFETNFYTDAAPFDRTVTLLGQRVDLHIVPSGFGWRFGDGEALTTADAGAPYPDLRITHSYQRKGGVTPAVDTTYTATYRVNGGPWADVPGSVTVPGVPVGLQVLTATPVLVGY
jgi:hypothetical protein